MYSTVRLYRVLLNMHKAKVIIKCALLLKKKKKHLTFTTSTKNKKTKGFLNFYISNSSAKEKRTNHQITKAKSI